ncbi:lactate utilization protein C [Peribacillus saganii]|uniref:Lactate utilization protein C n=2 Tax=Peribacillus saganii TaxID=2303992 RepID=A0A372LT76_9BACI|nr:lactate utilization protein C [Peribacillus saganii]
MAGTIQNREAFLSRLAGRLGREQVKETLERPIWKHQPQHEVMKGASIEELINVLKEHCVRIHTDFYRTKTSDLPKIMKEVVQEFGGGPVITTKDARFEEFGLSMLLSEMWPAEQIDVIEWNPELADKNIKLAERSNVGIVFSEITLAESATVVLFSTNEKGRSVSLLPQTFIAIIPKSTIVPRMTQAAKQIQAKVKNGEVLPACINFVTGPSNSADIEMNLVVGVHGPVKAAYILVDDM